MEPKLMLAAADAYTAWVAASTAWFAVEAADAATVEAARAAAADAYAAWSAADAAARAADAAAGRKSRETEMEPKLMLAAALMRAAESAASQGQLTARTLAMDAARKLNQIAYDRGHQPDPALLARARKIAGLSPACACCGNEVGDCFTVDDFMPSTLCIACADDAADIREQALAFREGR